jgi:cobalt-precorrin-5B (C1)-methyltransferase
MVGKLAKFAAGNESVHSRESSQDFALLSDLARRAGAEEGLAQQVHAANTAQEVLELMSEAGLTAFHDLVCQTAWTYAMSLTHRAYPLEILLLGRAGEVLGRYPQTESGR